MTTSTPPLTEQTDPYCLSPAEAAALLAGAPWRRFAVIGDSLARGTGGPTPGYAHLPWADRVADVLRGVDPDLTYRNTGVVGVTASETLAEQVPGLLAFEPDLVHISCGGNDLWRRRLDFATLEATLRSIFDAAAGTGALLTTFGLGRAFNITAVPGFADRVRALNDLSRRIAADYDAVLVDMWDHPINDRPTLISADGIHFSASGQAVVAAETIKALAGRISV